MYHYQSHWSTCYAKRGTSMHSHHHHQTWLQKLSWSSRTYDLEDQAKSSPWDSSCDSHLFTQCQWMKRILHHSNLPYRSWICFRGWYLPTTFYGSTMDQYLDYQQQDLVALTHPYSAPKHHRFYHWCHVALRSRRTQNLASTHYCLYLLRSDRLYQWLFYLQAMQSHN